MWSYFLVLVRTLAAAFWTICSLFIKRAEQPHNKALQKSNLEVINAWNNISAFDIGLSLDIFLSWKNAVLQMLEMWMTKERLLSNSTPRFLTDDEESTEEPSSVRQFSRLLLLWFLGPAINSSVFFFNSSVFRSLSTMRLSKSWLEILTDIFFL